MKKLIRKKILRERNNLSEKQCEEKSSVIQKRLLEMKLYKEAKAVFAYSHFGREVRTDILIRDALDKGKIVCIPKNNWKDSTMTPSQIFSVSEINQVGVPEPTVFRSYPAEKIDLVIVPGIAFDIQGNRIGMGKGFFDRFLSSISDSVPAIGLAYELQMLTEPVPVNPWDFKMSAIVTEERIINIIETK